MATISYKYGQKASYLALGTYDSNSLYFCTDTHELFKGEDLYSDGVRAVSSDVDLPEFTAAAEGILYFCEDTGNAYMLNEARDDWEIIVHGVDDSTIGYTTNGLLAIKAVPIASVAGLTERLSTIETIVISGGSEDVDGTVDTVDDLPTDAEVGDVYEVTEDGSKWYYNGEEWVEYNPSSSSSTSTLTPIATAQINSSQFKIDDNNVLNIIDVESSLVTYNDTTVEKTLNSILQMLEWEDMDALLTEVDLTDDEASVASVLSSAEDGTVVSLSEGTVSESLDITSTVTVKGANYGVAQNFAQEVE